MTGSLIIYVVATMIYSWFRRAPIQGNATATQRALQLLYKYTVQRFNSHESNADVIELLDSYDAQLWQRQTLRWLLAHLLLTLSAVTSRSLQSFVCVEAGTMWLLRANLDVTCWGPEHAGFMAISVIMFVIWWGSVLVLSMLALKTTPLSKLCSVRALLAAPLRRHSVMLPTMFAYVLTMAIAHAITPTYPTIATILCAVCVAGSLAVVLIARPAKQRWLNIVFIGAAVAATVTCATNTVAPEYATLLIAIGVSLLLAVTAFWLGAFIVTTVRDAKSHDSRLRQAVLVRLPQAFEMFMNQYTMDMQNNQEVRICDMCS